MTFEKIGILIVAFTVGAVTTSCSGKAKQAKAPDSPLIAPTAVASFPLDELPFATTDNPNQQTLNFRDVSSFVWPDPFDPEAGAKVLSLSRVRDENFEEKYSNEMTISQLDGKFKNGPAQLDSLRVFFDQQVLVQETKWTEQRAFVLPQALTKYTHGMAERGEIAKAPTNLGEFIDVLNADSDTISPLAQTATKSITNPGLRRNFETKLTSALKLRSELKTLSQQLKDQAVAAGYSAELEKDFRANDAEILRLKTRNDSSIKDSKVWSKWAIAQQNQRITEIIPHLVGLQAELISYPEIELSKNTTTGALSVKIAKFNPCFSGAEFANDLEFSTAKGNLTSVVYEPRGGVLSFAFNYDGPGIIDKEVPSYEVKTATDEAGKSFADRRGNPAIDFFPILRPTVKDDGTPDSEIVKKTVRIECYGGLGEVKVKRVRYTVKNQIIFQGDVTLTDKQTSKVKRGILRLARDL